MSPFPGPCAHAADLCVFGSALVRDDRYVLDAASAAALAERLARQALMAVAGPEAGDRRLAAFAQFIRLHRRRVSRMTAEQPSFEWERPATARCSGVAAAIRTLPLDEREALLLVALADFAHAEAAQVLQISRASLLERLDRARTRLTAATGAQAAPEQEAQEARAQRPSYLRVIK